MRSWGLWFNSNILVCNNDKGLIVLLIPWSTWHKLELSGKGTSTEKKATGVWASLWVHFLVFLRLPKKASRANHEGQVSKQSCLQNLALHSCPDFIPSAIECDLRVLR